MQKNNYNNNNTALTFIQKENTTMTSHNSIIEFNENYKMYKDKVWLQTELQPLWIHENI